MAEKPFSPALTDNHRKKLNQALHALAELIPELDKAERAGFDVKEERARCSYLRESCKKIKAAYFPDQP